MVTAEYDQTSKMLTIDIKAAYDPDVALIIGFQPVTAARTKLSDVAVCENRASTSFTDTWAWTSAAPSACAEPDAYLYPSTDLWKQVESTCHTVAYQMKRKLPDLQSMCGNSIINTVTSNGTVRSTGGVYLTYVRMDGTHNWRDEHHFTFQILDQLAVAEYSQTKSTTSNMSVSKPDLVKTDDMLDLVWTTTVPKGNAGQPCSMELVGDNGHVSFIRNRACDADVHCSPLNCDTLTGVCTQTWLARLSGGTTTSAYAGSYTFRWSTLDCTGWPSSAEYAKTAGFDDLTITLKHTSSFSFARASKFVPYVRATVLNAASSTHAGELDVRVEPLGLSTIGVCSLVMCQVPSDCTNIATYVCPDGSTTLWSASADQKATLNVPYALDASVLNSNTWLVQATPTQAFAETGTQVLCPDTGTCLAACNARNVRFGASDLCGADEPEESEETPIECEEEEEEEDAEEEVVTPPEEETPPVIPPPDDPAEDGLPFSRMQAMATLVLTALGALIII